MIKKISQRNLNVHCKLFSAEKTCSKKFKTVGEGAGKPRYFQQDSSPPRTSTYLASTRFSKPTMIPHQLFQHLNWPSIFYNASAHSQTRVLNKPKSLHEQDFHPRSFNERQTPLILTFPQGSIQEVLLLIKKKQFRLFAI